jgi:hypothetical protein
VSSLLIFLCVRFTGGGSGGDQAKFSHAVTAINENHSFINSFVLPGRGFFQPVIGRLRAQSIAGLRGLQYIRTWKQFANECSWKVKSSASRLSLAESKASESLDAELRTSKRKPL